MEAGSIHVPLIPHLALPQLAAPGPVLVDELAEFVREGTWPQGQAENAVTLFTQRDHVHDALKHLISKAQSSLVLTMFGYDDDELDELIRGKLSDPHVFVQLSLDRSQSGGKHEQDILAKWSADQLGNSVAIGTSAAGAIAHMKSGVIDGLDVFDGSTNWSMSGEGAEGAKAQNNTLVVIRDHAAAVRYRAQLDIDHDAMLAQQQRRAARDAAAKASPEGG